MKKQICVLLMVAVFLFALGACSPSEQPPTGGASPSGQEGTSPGGDSAGDGKPEEGQPLTGTAMLVGSEPVSILEFNFHYVETVTKYLSEMGVDNSDFDFSSFLSSRVDEENESDTRTYGDVFYETVQDNLHHYIALYQEAVSEGFALSADDEAGIENYLQSMRDFSSQQGVSMDEFLAAQYGDGMTEELAGRFMTRYTLGYMYESSLLAAYSFTDAQLQAYYEENKESNDIYEGNAISVRVILLSDEAKADEVYQMFLDGEQTEEAFVKLAREYSEDENTKENGGLYADVTPGKTGEDFDDFDAWCFDSERKPGDYAKVHNEYGYHLLYFSAVGEPYWKLWSREAMTSDTYMEYSSELADKYPLAMVG